MPGVAAIAEKIEKLLAERFRARWKSVETEFANGIDVAKAHADFFFAGDGGRGLRIARRYYTPARATKFANSSINEIADLCWAWFIPFQYNAHHDSPGLRELRDQLDQ